MVSVSMNALSELLKKRLSDWEALYEHELSDAELRLWLDTFQKLRITEALLESALRIVQTKAVKFPKPGHLAAAIEDAINERDREANRNSNYLDEMRKTPHISELPKSERDEIKRLFDETCAKILADQLPKYPHARSPAERKDEVNRQKTAFAARLPHADTSKPVDQGEAPSVVTAPTASPAPPIVESSEPTPEDLAEEPPFQASDEDVPF